MHEKLIQPPSLIAILNLVLALILSIAAQAATPTSVFVVYNDYYIGNDCRFAKSMRIPVEVSDTVCKPINGTHSLMTSCVGGEIALNVYETTDCSGSPAVGTLSNDCVMPSNNRLSCVAYVSNRLLQLRMTTASCNGLELDENSPDSLESTYVVNKCRIRDPESPTPTSERITVTGTSVSRYQYETPDCIGSPSSVLEVELGECFNDVGGNGHVFAAAVPGTIINGAVDEPIGQLVVQLGSYNGPSCSGQPFKLHDPGFLVGQCSRFRDVSIRGACLDDDESTGIYYRFSTPDRTGAAEILSLACEYHQIQGYSTGLACHPQPSNQLVYVRSASNPCNGMDFDEDSTLFTVPVLLGTCARSVLSQNTDRSQKVFFKNNTIKIYEFDEENGSDRKCATKILRKVEIPLDECVDFDVDYRRRRLGDQHGRDLEAGQSIIIQVAVPGIMLAETEEEEPRLEQDDDDGDGDGDEPATDPSSACHILVSLSAVLIALASTLSSSLFV